MSREEIETKINDLQELIATYQNAMTEENKEELESKIQEAQDEINELKGKLGEMDKQEDEELQKAVSPQNENYENLIKENEREIKEISDFLTKSKGMLSKKEMAFYNDRLSFLKDQNAQLRDISQSYDAIEKIRNNKKLTKKEKNEKVSKEKDKIRNTKKAMKENGSFGEIISSLFGEINKRTTNALYKSNLMYQNACKRSESAMSWFSYTAPRLAIGLFLGVGGLVMGGVGIYPAVIGLAYSALAATKSITALTRLIKKTDMTQMKERKISQLSWSDKIKNAVYKFSKTRGLGKNKETVKNNTNVPVTEKKKEETERSVNIDEFRKDLQIFTERLKEVSKMDEENKRIIDKNKIDYEHYSKLKVLYENLEKKYGDRIPESIKTFYQNYCQQYLENRKKCVDNFIALVNELDIENIDNDKLNKCSYFYKLLEEKYNGTKDIDQEIIKKYNACLEKIKTPTKEEGKEDKVIYDEFDKQLLYEVTYFQLVPTKESCQKCEELIDKIWKLDVNRRKKFHGIEKAYNKFKYLRNHLDNMKKIVKFIELVNGEKLGEEKLRQCFELYNSFTEEELALIPREVKRGYQDALRYNLALSLRLKLEKLDIDKCVRERKFDDINECLEMHNKINNYIAGNIEIHGSDGTKKASISKDRLQGLKDSLASFPKELLDKIVLANNVMTQLHKYENTKLRVTFVLDNKMKTYAKCSFKINNKRQEQYIYVDDIRDDMDKIVERIIMNNPYVNVENIEFLNGEVKNTSRSR